MVRRRLSDLPVRRLCSNPWIKPGLTRDLLARTEPPRRAKGERKLAHNVFMQVTWGLLGLAALGQLFLLIWLDVTS